MNTVVKIPDSFGRQPMHKRKSLRKDAERVAKSTQVKLDEVFYRIEQDKKRTVMLNRFERIKVWNELREIRRVFVPQYVPKCGLEQEPQRESSKDVQEDEQTEFDQNNNEIKQKGYERQTRSANLSDAALSLRRHRQSVIEEKKKSTQGVSEQMYSYRDDEKNASSSSSNEKRKLSIEDKESLTGRRSATSPASLRFCENSLSYMELNQTSRENTRPYVPLSQRNNTSPSNTMLSVSSGYLSFKKLVKDKAHTQSLISPRFRSKSDSEITIEGQSAFLRSATFIAPKNTPQSNANQLVKELLDKSAVKSQVRTKSARPSSNVQDKRRHSSSAELERKERRLLSASAGTEQKSSLHLNNKRPLTRKKSEEGTNTFSGLKNIIEETTDLKKIPEKRQVWQ